MKKIVIVGCAIIASSVLMAAEMPELKFLTGDTKLACEAVLCLSSPHRPSECNPSLQRYFSISYKSVSKTHRKRKDFLNQCPQVSDTEIEKLSKITQNKE